MESISRIYKDLIDYLSEINITEIWEYPKDDGLISAEYDIFFNGKNKSGFLEDIDRLTFNIYKDLSDSLVLENPTDDHFIEIDSIINSLSSNLIAKNSFGISERIDVNSDPIVNTFVSEVVEKLHKHKNTWNLKSETIGNQPANFPLQWNEKINKLVDIFYQLSYEIKNGDKDPLIKSSKITLAKFIVNNFVDKDGHNLSLDTVYTVLKDSRTEKRPSIDKRIKISYFPM